jgi:arylsulfatase A-like enzyme
VERPSVVLIVVDTLRADHLTGSRNGVPFMPKLSAMAEDSWHFVETTSQASWTKPSMVSLFTSLYTETHGVEFGTRKQFLDDSSLEIDMMPKSLESMARYFKDHGYDTAGIQTNHQLVADFGFAEGFDVYHMLGDVPASAVSDKAIKVAAELTPPYFLYVHLLDPHASYEPPETYRALFEDGLTALSEEEEEILENYGEYYDDHILHYLGRRKVRQIATLSEEAREVVRARYGGESRFSDDEVARLIAEMRGKNGNTIVAFTSDHGEEFWDHGAVGHSKSLYQELIHVPMFISVPGAAPRHDSQSAQLIDLMPTFAELCGLKARPYWQGVSLVGERVDRPVFSATGGSSREHDFRLRTVRLDRHKLIHDGNKKSVSLYDLVADPEETRDLAESEKALTKTLLEALQKHKLDNEKHPKFQATRERILIDDDVREQLKILGYGGEN